MRARSLKPSIFKNELLAVADPLYTLIFEGLWCAADREGRLEDRPGKLHIEINPGRAFEGTERALAWLVEHEFIVRYAVEGKKYIAIPTFLKHQRPHQNEKPSVLPGPELATKVTSEAPKSDTNGEPRSQATCDQGTTHFALTPDSGLLTPDSGLPPPGGAGGEAKGSGKPKSDPIVTETITALRAIYPKRSGSQRWPEAEKALRARLKEGYTPQQVLDGATRYARFIAASGKAGTGYVQMASTFLGTSKGFLEDWEPPTPAGPQRRLTKFEQLTAGLALGAGEEAA